MTDPIDYDELAEAVAGADTAVGEDSVTVDSAPVEEPVEAEQVAEASEPLAQPEAESAEPTEPEAAPAAEEPTGPETEPSAEETVESTDGPEGEAAAVDGDDVTAAVAAATENVGGTSTFDDIAPGTVAAADGELAGEATVARSASTVSIWPFVVYDLFWAAFAGLLVWQFQTLPPGTAVYEAELYPTALLVGVVLLVAGPLLIFVSWIASWDKPGSTKGRLFLSALVRGSVATLLGVTMWWIALIALDQLRLGAPL